MKSLIEFSVSGLTLRGNLYIPDQPNSKPLALLFLHGWTGKPNDAAAVFLATHGIASMTFSLSGHNDSDGDIAKQTRQKSLQEVLAAYDLLRQHTKAGIVAIGNSYGGYLAALLSAERPLAAMSLRVPANYPDERSDEQQLNQRDTIMDWRELALEFKATRSLKAIHDFTGAVQIIEAEFDEMVPHQTVQNYVSAVSNKAKLDFHLMKGWPHSIGNSQERAEQLQDILLHWLEQKV